MTEISAREVLDFLRAASSTPAPPASGPVYEMLLAHRVVTSSGSGAALTPVGETVRAELELRSYRLGDLPLEALSTEMSELAEEMDRVAHSAESFLGDVGPLPPPESFDYMPMAATCVAHADLEADELAESFRNCWGLIDVLEGEAPDRLLAAVLLMRSGAPTGRFYGHLMTTLPTVRRAVPPPSHPVTVAALLHLYPKLAAEAPLAEWGRWRAKAGSDVAAALLAGRPADPAFEGRLRKLTDALAPGSDRKEAGPAALHLLLLREDAEARVPKVLALAALLRGRLPAPVVAASVLVGRHDLSPEELLDWVTKAAEIARNRHLARAPAALTALGVAIVAGLATERFHRPGAPPPAMDDADAGEETDSQAVSNLVALQGVLYRRILASPPTPAG